MAGSHPYLRIQVPLPNAGTILRGPGGQVGGTMVLEARRPYAPADGSVNMERVMVALAGAIAEEVAAGLAYGSDGQTKSDHACARRWASRDGELPEAATQANLKRGWDEAKQKLVRRWSHVKALADALLERKVLSGTEVIARVPHSGESR